MRGDEGHTPFISLFMMIPVSGIMTWLPKMRLIVLVIEMARPPLSIETMWDVPGLS
jgi:hypothetical protein